jgi:hypothetical protein
LPILLWPILTSPKKLSIPLWPTSTSPKQPSLLKVITINFDERLYDWKEIHGSRVEGYADEVNPWEFCH